MGKKKSKNKSKNKSAGKIRKLSVPFGFVIAICLVVGSVYFMTKPEPPSDNPAQATGFLIETRPVLSHARFTGKAALAYRYAAEIPKVLDAQFCYCYCKEKHNHKNLLTCFTSNHGSKCEICMDEVIYAHKLYKEGRSMDEIVIAIDEKFYRPFPTRRL